MLSMADTDINQFFPVFASVNIPVAFLVPTPTGYKKSIMDATSPLRQLLLDAQVHNYKNQQQGPENKVLLQSYFVNYDSLTPTTASLYRPLTKKGDPRIWFSNLREYCQPRNLLAIVVINREIYVFNLSDPLVADELKNGGFAYSILQESAEEENAVVNELLELLHSVHNQGFLPSITSGDPGVGDTLEHALGIKRNNSKSPDYKGIELKAMRISKNGSLKPVTRDNLFAQVPDEGMKYREIIDHYGKVQIPKNSKDHKARLQLYETCRCSRTNAYGLKLYVDSENDKLKLLHQISKTGRFSDTYDYVSAWMIKTLQNRLITKHPATFWVQAESEFHNNIECFKYNKVLYTRHPNASLFAPLLEKDKITVDIAGHYEPSGKFRDHGFLFKMLPSDLPMLLGTPQEYIL